MFRRQSAEPTTTVEPEPTDAHSGKGAPTPTRRQQEAARRRPLVPEDRKEAARMARMKQTETRERARVGMASGDDKYLTARDRGPQRRYVRDFVDARWNIGELLIPVLLIVIIISFFSGQNTSLQTYGLIILWVFAAITLIDCLYLGTQVRRRLRDKFGYDKLERGVRWYASMRSLQFRFIRLPKVQVKRGQYPE